MGTQIKTVEVIRKHTQTTDTIKWIGSEYKYAGIVGATRAGILLACYFRTCTSIVLSAKRQIIGGGGGDAIMKGGQQNTCKQAGLGLSFKYIIIFKGSDLV